MRLLFLSNGFGEDAIGARLAQAILSQDSEVVIQALPLVGEGKSYQKLKDSRLTLLGPAKELPSGGFIRGLYWIIRDVLGGLVFLTLGQISTLKKIRSQVDYVVSVGDVFPLFLAARYVQKPQFFLSTAKSSYVGEHTPREEDLMRKSTVRVFPRDQKTADSLASRGVPAEFPGNVMMDCLEIKDLQPRLTEIFPPGEIIGILPGSRPEAYRNLTLVLEGIFRLIQDINEKENFNFVAALAPTLKLEKIIMAAQNHGWFYEPAIPAQRKNGVLGKLKLKEAGHFLKEKEVSLLLTVNRFAEVLKVSRLVIGLSGTANEQAVGLGKPVIAFPGKGPQITLDFLRTQEKLLGGAIDVVLPRPSSISAKIQNILNNPARFEEVARIGQERMGPPGASEKIAEMILDYIRSSHG